MNTNENVNEIGTQNIGKLLIKFSVPAGIGLLCSALQNIVNRVSVGNAVGSVALAGVAISYPVMILFIAIAMLIGVGSTSLAAIKLGQNKQEDAEALLGQAIVLSFAAPLIFCIIGFIVMEPLLVALGATKTIIPYAKEYLFVIMPAMIFACPSLSVNNFIRTEGNPRTSMYTQILGSIINVIVNYICVIQLGWGVKGAALGVLVGNLASLIWVLSYFRSKKSTMKIRKKHLHLNTSLSLKIAALGMAPFLMQLAASVQQLIMNRTLSFYGGDDALAALGIVTSLSMLLAMPIIGINQGSQPIMGYNYGANNFSRVKETLFKAILYSVLFAFVSFVVIQLFAKSLVSVFAQGEASVINLAAHALRIYFFCLPIIGFQMVATGYFQATRKPVHAALLGLSRQVLLFIPLLLILPNFFALDGAWFTAPVADAASGIITAAFIFVAMKKLNKSIKEPEILGFHS